MKEGKVKKKSIQTIKSAHKEQDTDSQLGGVQKMGLPSCISKAEERELKHHGRRLSIKEGIFWSVRASFGDHFVAPFAIANGMASSLVTILNSTWNLGPIGQLFGSKKVGKTSRKKTVAKTMLMDTFGWLFMALIAFLYLKQIAIEYLPYLIIADMVFILLSSGYGHPSWFSWIGDIVDSKFRGRWFSKRSTIISFTTTILAISAAFFIEYMKEIGKDKIAFIILFFIAFLGRLYGTFIIKRTYEPELKIKRERKFSLKHFVLEAKKTNLGKYTLFRTTLALIMGLSAPLTSIYLLRYLELDYVSYIAIMLAGTFFSVITLNLWGKIADIYGNYRVIALTTLIIPLTPLLWILSSSIVYLLIVPTFIGGTAWSAFLMASGNFIYDNTTKDIRGKAISYFNLFVGVGAFIGGIIASILIKTIHTTWIEPLFLIFIIATFLRMITIGIFVPKLKEVKRKKKFEGLKELEHIIFKEAKPTLIEDIHEISSIGSYIKE